MANNTRITRNDPTSWETFDLRHLLPNHKEGICLDLGCGPGIAQEMTSRGYQYIGLDRFPVTGADIQADATALPFADNHFDLIIAASSFEHFPDPWSAAREIARILKPGGYAVISLSFLEPYHARSYFHMSHLGAKKLFTDAGLTIEIIEPFEWSGIEASMQALVQLRFLRWLSGLLVKSTLLVRRLAIKHLTGFLSEQGKRQRAMEFLAEEPFRFTAGIKVRACKK